MNYCESEKHEIIKDKLNESAEFNLNVQKASEIFSLIGEPNRMRIILALAEGELCVYHICEITGGSQSATSQHLKKLKDSNLVKCRKQANLVLYSLADEHVADIVKLTLQHLNCK